MRLEAKILFSHCSHSPDRHSGSAAALAVVLVMRMAPETSERDPQHDPVTC